MTIGLMFTLKNSPAKAWQRFVLLSCLILASCGGGGSSSGSGSNIAPAPTPTPTPAPTPTLSVVAIGDSIGNGFGVATGWPVLLADILGAPVNNNSVTNEQTDFGVRIIGERLDAVQPTHVVILLGTNDAIRGSVDVAIANLQTMVDAARSRNVIPIVGTLPPITRDAGENARAESISAGIRSLSGARLAGVRGAFGDGRGLLVDGIHPNDTGQMIIADAFAQQFQQ